MSRLLLPTTELDSDFPFEISTLYSGRSCGRYTWLTRVGPDGHRGRILWVLVHEFNEFCRNRGIKYRLQLEGAR